MRISSNVSVEKHLASLELIRGPPRNRASKSLILSMAVVMAITSEATTLLVVATTAAEEEEVVDEVAIPFGVAALVLVVDISSSEI